MSKLTPKEYQEKFGNLSALHPKSWATQANILISEIIKRAFNPLSGEYDIEGECANIAHVLAEYEKVRLAQRPIAYEHRNNEKPIEITAFYWLDDLESVFPRPMVSFIVNRYYKEMGR